MFVWYYCSRRPKYEFSNRVSGCVYPLLRGDRFQESNQYLLTIPVLFYS